MPRVSQETEDVIGIEPNFKAMLDWAVENGTEITMHVIDARFGEVADPTDHVKGCAQVVVQLKTCSCTSHRRRKVVDSSEWT